jgi:hypothetical protein
LSGEQQSLDVALYDALPDAVKRAWTQLKPMGEIDFTADIVYRTGQPQASIGVEIHPRPDSAQLNKPDFFPYLMESVAGTISYHDGKVTLRGFEARHDRTVIRTDGSGYFSPEGQWQFQLTGLTADNVEPRQDLISALPARLRTLVDRLRPTGSFSLHQGTLEFHKSASEIAPLVASWNVAIDCHQTDLACGIDLKNIHGTVRLAGKSDGVRSSTAGELDLENVMFQDVQFTNVRGPLWVDESKCLLGRWATEELGQPERRLTARAYDGAVNASAWVIFDNLPQYQTQVNVVGADLRRIVVERFGGGPQFSGKVDANLVLSGRGSYLESLMGDGDVHVRDANLYELSLLASLLKMFRTGGVDKTAFTQSDVSFRVEGRKILLDEINFLGDVVNLYGHGQSSFDQKLELAFRAEIGRHENHLPMVRALVKETNQQIMQLYVNGTFAQPVVTTEAFPGISQWLHQLGSDLRDPTSAADRRQAERRRLAAQQDLQAR